MREGPLHAELAFHAGTPLEATACGAGFLFHGTLTLDVMESTCTGRVATVIRTHDNVGELPANLGFELVDPFYYAFKDEVQRVKPACYDISSKPLSTIEWE